MNILLLGQGGREHALARALAASQYLSELFISPGNPGTAQCGQNVELNGIEEILAFCESSYIELVVISDTKLLAAGLADKIRARNIAVVGPGAKGARLESSKLAAKQFMLRHGLPTANFLPFSSKAYAEDYLKSGQADSFFEAGGLVIKEDALLSTHGLGTRLCYSKEQALEALKEMPEGQLLFEELLEGPEYSYISLIDETHVVPLSSVQDHKRSHEDCRGFNTEGMGAYSPVPQLSKEDEEEMKRCLEKVFYALREEEIDYRGFLYAGFIKTQQGLKILEFNTRLGDPEAQALLPRLQIDMVELLLKCAEARLSELNLYWLKSFAVAVVLSVDGYPKEEFLTGQEILGVDEAWGLTRLHVYQGDTADKAGSLVVAGSRPITVVGLGSSFEEAKEKAYKAAELIKFEDKRYRSDIGYQVQA